MQGLSRDAALQFLEALEAGGKFVFKTLDDQKKGRKNLEKTLYGTFDQHEKELAALNRQGAGIFVNINRTDETGQRRAENISGCRALFVDLDGAPLDPVRECPLPPSLIVETSPERWHCYWLVKDWPLGSFTLAQKELIKKFGADPAVHDLPRVMRLPGFLHRKGDPFLTKIILDHSEDALSREDMIRFLSLSRNFRMEGEENPFGPLKDTWLLELKKRDMVLKKGKEGKYLIKCPWSATHSGGDLEAAFWLPNYGGIEEHGFKCLHAHCSERKARDLHAFLFPKDRPEDEGVWGADIPSNDTINTEPAWTSLLIRSEKGLLRVNSTNLLSILTNDEEYKGKIRWNEFTQTSCMGSPGRNETLEDWNIVLLAARLERKYQWSAALSVKMLDGVVEAAARHTPFHPVRDYLEGLAWDQIPRLNSFFHTYYQTDDSYYTSSAGLNFMIGAVARVMRPGCKHDCMPILEGRQGLMKSSSLKVLFSPVSGQTWFSEINASPENKDFNQNMRGKWCLEFADLDTFSRAETNRVKSQMSTSVDNFRTSYGRRNADFPRQSVFVATTNDDNYLKDPTGARRYWPIRCEKILIGKIEKDRDQLWAEALHRYKKGETWWIVPETAKDEQEARFSVDSWEEVVVKWLDSPVRDSRITTTEILQDCFGLEVGKHSRQEQIRLGIVMKHLGWEKKREGPRGSRYYFFERF